MIYMVEIEERKVMSWGKYALGIALGRILKKIGINKGDIVKVVADGNRVVIAKSKPDVYKPVNIPENVWREFLGIVAKEYGDLDNIDKAFNEALQLYIEEKKSLWARIMHKKIM